MANPRFPLYIPSKGRWEDRRRLTARALDRMNVPYRIVVEEQEFDQYAQVVDPSRLLVLDKAYQRDYDTFDDLGDTKSKGPGPARNFIWEHAIAEGHEWHWVMDDNIRAFYRMNHNVRNPVSDGTIFRVMEDFVLRFTNVAMAGPNYTSFIPRRLPWEAFRTNTRIYSCNLIRNDLPYRWRGRYNEDTDLSLRMLKDGWCTIQFNAFLQWKTWTQQIKGGNTEEFYAKEGTTAKSTMLARMHPDVARVTWRYGRVHHWVDYRPFAVNKLRRRPGLKRPDGVNNYGMVRKPRGDWWQKW